MSRDLYVSWMQALTTFIVENRVFPVGSDMDREEHIVPHTDAAGDCRSMVERLHSRGYDYVKDEDWLLQTKVLAYFLHNAPLVRDTIQPIQWTSGNISRCASFDPLTYDGLCEIHHFIHNGIYDDTMLSAYKGQDGDLRIIGEWEDDHFRWGKPAELPDYIMAKLGKPPEWFHAAERTHVSSDTITSILDLDALTADQLAVPTQDQLYEMWVGRPYDDFSTPTYGR
jgi:hypothetical protein